MLHNDMRRPAGTGIGTHKHDPRSAIEPPVFVAAHTGYPAITRLSNIIVRDFCSSTPVLPAQIIAGPLFLRTPAFRHIPQVPPFQPEAVDKLFHVGDAQAHHPAGTSLNRTDKRRPYPFQSEASGNFQRFPRSNIAVYIIMRIIRKMDGRLADGALHFARKQISNSVPRPQHTADTPHLLKPEPCCFRGMRLAVNIPADFKKGV